MKDPSNESESHDNEPQAAQETAQSDNQSPGDESITKPQGFKFPPVYPFFFALLPMLKVWDNCMGSYLPEQYALVIAFILIKTLLCFALVYYLAKKDLDKTGVIVGVLVGTLYFWLGFEALVQILTKPNKIDNLILLPIYLALCANAIYVILRWMPIAKLTMPLNLYSIFIFMMSVFPVVAGEIKQQEHVASAKKQIMNLIPVSKLKAPSPAPDVYYIVADCYPNAQTLNEQFHYKSALIEHLKEKKFYVAENASSAHDRTTSSVPSTLNMCYLGDLVKESYEVRFRLLQDSEVSRLLKAAGYKYINVSSSWEPTDYNTAADMNVGWLPGGNFHIALLRLTVVAGLEERLKVLANIFKVTRTRTFSVVTETARIGGPKFVLMHTLVAHPPNFLDHDGNVTTLSLKMHNEEFMPVPFIDQIKYFDREMIKLVDTIIDESKGNAIIIIESDHGSAVHEASVDTPYVNERMRILAAVHLPEGYDKKPPSDLCAVNTFRWLFDSYYAANIPMLENKAFIAVPYDPEQDIFEVYSKMTFPEAKSGSPR